jgi:hypothetical protein
MIVGARHGEIEMLVPASAASWVDGSGPVLATGGNQVEAIANGDRIFFPFQIPAGSIISAYSAWGSVITGGDSFHVKASQFVPGGGELAIGTEQTSPTTSAAHKVTEDISGTPYTIVTDASLVLRMRADAGNAGAIFGYMASVTYLR